MGARNDLEWAILGGAGFQVYSHCNQLLEERGGWLDEE
jgi:hypothetical protein